MLKIAPIAGGGSDYYVGDGTTKSGYYLSDNNRTYWGGGAKEGLGLNDGEIKAEDFDRLMDGFVTDGKRIGNPTKDGGWSHDQGRDLTFSASKSFSILFQGPHRPKLQSLQLRAIEKTMAFAEKNFAKARIKGEIVGNQKIIWAVVNEETSRANDPNTHGHVIFFNIVQGEDGKFRAMDNQLFYDNQVLLGQIYRAELAAGIKELGFSIEPVGKHGQWEIKDIPVEIRQGFSKRRQVITAMIDPNNDTAKARENICLITRPSKQNILRSDLLKAWNQELSEHGTSFEELSVPKSKTVEKAPWTIENCVKTSVDIIAETRTQTTTFNLYREIMDRTDGHFTIDQIEAEVTNLVTKGYLQRSGDGSRLARSKDLWRKEYVIQELQKGHLKSKPLVSEKKLLEAFEGTNLKDDQKAAIRIFTRSNSRYVKIQGDAGTGKTTALETAVPLIQQAGYKVIGLSTTNESTEKLEESGVFDKVMTLQRYLLVPEGDKKTVLVIDESSMIGRDQMLDLLRFTNKKKMPRVLFQGDAKQMNGVLAGEPFKDMEKAGVRSVVMGQIIRQKNMTHREAISHIARGELKEAFEKFAPEIHEVSLDNHMQYAVSAWAKTNDIKTPIIVQTNKQKNEINAAIKASQNINAPDSNILTLKTWQTVYKTTPEKSLVRSYKDATHIRFNRNYKRFKITRGDIFKIEVIDENKSELTLSKDGRERKFNPALYKMGKGAIELYRQEERSLQAGDRIRFTRGGHHQPVNNNEMGMVKSIQDGQVTFDLDRKKTISLSLKDKAIRHIDHAWASTTHAYQGKTVPHSILLMPSRYSPLTSLASLYTGVSRHSLSVTIVTDDADKLQANIERKLKIDKIDANIRWPEHAQMLREARFERKFKIDKMDANIKWPEHEVQMRQETTIETSHDNQPAQDKQSEKEVHQEQEYEEDMSMGM